MSVDCTFPAAEVGRRAGSQGGSVQTPHTQPLAVETDLQPAHRHVRLQS